MHTEYAFDSSTFGPLPANVSVLLLEHHDNITRYRLRDERDGNVLSIVRGAGTHGGEHGLFEIYDSREDWDGDGGDGVVGYLNAEQVAAYINAWSKGK